MSTLNRLDSDLDLQTAILASPEDDYEEFLTRCFHYSPKSADEPVSRKKNDLDIFKQRLSMRGMSMRDLLEKRMSRKFSADVDFDLCTTIDEVREVIKREEARTSTESGMTDSDNHSNIAKHVEQATPLVSVSVDNTVVESFEHVEAEPETLLRGSMDGLREELLEQSLSSITMEEVVEAAVAPKAALKPATAAAAPTAAKKGVATVARGITRSATTVKEAAAPKPPSLSSVGRQSSAAAVPPRPPMARANTVKAPAAPPAAVVAANKGPADIARAALLLAQKNSNINKSTTKIASSSAASSSSAVSKPAGPKRTSSGIMGESSSSSAVACSGLKRSNSANKVTRPGLATINSKVGVKFNASEAMAV